MNQIIKRVSMFFTFYFLLSIASSCENFELASITPTIAQKVSGLKVELKGDDAVLTWTNPANVKSIEILHSDGTSTVEEAVATWSYGIIDVNKDYFFTVKIKDADGNLSLGETVYLRREGPEAVKNFKAVQEDKDLVLTWDLAQSGLKKIELLIDGNLVSLPGTATSYRISNIAVGKYAFKINVFNSSDVISPSRKLEFLVSFKIRKIAFLGAAAENTTAAWAAINGSDFPADDDRTAAEWFKTLEGPFLQTAYHSFEDVANGNVNLSVYDVIWIQYDGAWWGGEVDKFPNNSNHCLLKEVGFGFDTPCRDIANGLVAQVKAYYQNGGNILVGNFAAMILDDIGVVDGSGVPNNNFGGLDVDSGATNGTWGGSWLGDTSSPYFANVISFNGSCVGPGFDLLSAGTLKKNRVAQYNLNFGPWAGGTTTQAQVKFENITGSKILWGNCDGKEIWGVEWASNGTKGTVVCAIGGTYDWYVGNVENTQNIKILTKNILTHLADLRN